MLERLPRQERTVLAWIALETLLFALTAERFFTVQNAMEVIRSATEFGLLAVAATFVMKTSGIDLSVGSIMGLVAVTLGATHAGGVPAGLAALAAVGAGTLCGCANGALVTRLRVPPLVATLATMALFRGLAEGFTGGYRVWTAWPAGFLTVGQGYMFGVVPVQLPLLGVAILAGWIGLHRMPFGRRLTAIGFAEQAAHYARVPVGRCVFAAYALSGLAAGLAGVLYVAHVGQAKADAGTGYELVVITMVVLGGTSIDGGRGTIAGSVLGVFAIAILQNGLLLARQPSEVSQVLVGCCLVGAVLAQGLGTTRWVRVALVSGALLAAVWIVSGTGGPARGNRLTVGMMPKAKSDPYFVSCRRGAEAAAAEFGVDLIWDGPTELDAARQNDVVEAWITRGVDVIAVSVENRDAISTVLRKARRRGIKVLTWDADAQADSRDFLINQATPRGIGSALADEAARVLGGKGRFAIVTATLTAANQNEWIRHIEARLKQAHPGVAIATIRPSDGKRDKALTETKNLMRAFPDVRLVCAIAAPAVPGAAEAIKQEGRNVKVIGLSVPSLCRSYVHSGIVESIVLWNTIDLGYLTVRAASLLGAGTLHRGVTSIDGGRLGPIEVQGDEVLLGKPFRFDKSNIDDFDF